MIQGLLLILISLESFALGKPSRRRFLQWGSLGLTALLGSLSGLKPGQVSAANPIEVENAKPGDGDWYLNLISHNDLNEIKGYASATSINKGETIDLHISIKATLGTACKMEVFRVGWYAGVGARKLRTVNSIAAGERAVPPPDAATGMVDCNWPTSYTLATDPAWVSGHYLIKLTIINPDPTKQYQNYIHFVLRDDARSTDLLFKSSVSTYQAYNNFGGKSLYDYNSSGANTSIGTKRAYKVSFNRPYIDEGCGDFLFWEVAMVRFLEKNTYDVSYCTSLDFHTDTNLNLLLNNESLRHKGLLSDGHDEYWTKEMFDHTLAARDLGIGLAFFGANPCYWQMRLENSPSGAPNRVVVCYKDNIYHDNSHHDPMYNLNNAVVTTRFRDAPVNRPESELTGVMYNNYWDWDQGHDYIVSNSSHWVYQGTGLAEGTHIPGLVGYEWDCLFPGSPHSANLVKLSSSTVPNFHDNDPSTLAGAYPLAAATPASSCIYQAPSGAWVFSSGTVYWAYGCNYFNYQSKNLENAGIQRATANVLNAFIALPGRQVPVVYRSEDDGTRLAGTLSFALKWTLPGQQISLNGPFPNNQINITGPLPPVPPGVTLDGDSCGPSGPVLILDGSGTPGGTDGLVLSNAATVKNLKITHFKGRQIVSTGDGNRLKCVIAKK